MTVLTGSCHCGNIKLRFETSLHPSDLKLRACDCSFCRKHGVRSVMDPNGAARIEVADKRELSRYVFGLRTAEFLVCKRCGVYAGAVLRDGGSTWAVVNANLLDGDALANDAVRSSYGAETAGGRIDRRKREWTPARIEVGQRAGGAGVLNG
ncbi:MAG TPA: hypothetical protein VGH20_20545 [Myxococcales bacterium]|jgi:hypothetical protein